MQGDGFLLEPKRIMYMESSARAAPHVALRTRHHPEKGRDKRHRYGKDHYLPTQFSVLPSTILVDGCSSWVFDSV
jgi:hypothetical protein